MFRIVFFILITSFFFTFPITAQVQNNQLQQDYFDKQYGKDLLLHQGRLFYPEWNIVSGHPFWGQENFIQGDLIIEGTRFKNQRIKYDIYNQLFILSFYNSIGSEKQIVLNSESIDTVYLENSIFIRNPITKINSTFIQLVHNGSISCYISWQKEKKVQPDNQKMGYSYSSEKQVKYLIYDSVLYKFKNKRNLASIFPNDKREEIRNYIATNDIDLKKVDSRQLKQLIQHIETLIERR